MSNFLHAKLFDGKEANGRPRINRASLGLAEAGKVLAYLEAGQVLLIGLGYDKDQLDPAQPQKVPMAYLTDGTWIWSAAGAYYLREHGIAPEAQFISHIRAHQYTMPSITQEQIDAAETALLQRMHAQAMPGTPVQSSASYPPAAPVQSSASYPPAARPQQPYASSRPGFPLVGPQAGYAPAPPVYLPPSGAMPQQPVALPAGYAPAPLAYPLRAPFKAPNTVSRRGLILGLAGGALGLSALGGAAYWYVKNRASAPPAPSLVSTFSIPDAQSGSIFKITWSPDGQRLATVEQVGLRSWNALGGGNEVLWPYDAVHQYWNGDFAWTQGALVTVWAEGNSDIESKNAILHVDDALSNRSLFTYTRYASSGQKLASAAQAVYSQGAGVLLTPAAAFLSPEGGRVASMNDQGEIRIWNALSGADICVFHAPPQPGDSAESAYQNGALWSPDGKRLLTWGDDRVLHIWNASNGTLLTSYTGHWQERQKYGSNDYLDAITWSPDGLSATSLVVVDKDSGMDMQGLHIWDTRNGNRVATFQDEISRNIFWSPDSKMIALNNGHICIINAATGSVLFTRVSGGMDIGFGAALSWSPNAGRIGTNPNSKDYDAKHGFPTFQVWDAVSGKNVVNYLNTRHTANQQQNVPDAEDALTVLLAWSPDRQYIAAVTGMKYPLIEIWKGGW